jgi:hypothetical protein
MSHKFKGKDPRSFAGGGGSGERPVCEVEPGAASTGFILLWWVGFLAGLLLLEVGAP